MSNTCPCNRPTGPDAYLCRHCTQQLRADIRHAPAWADDLKLVTARLVRYTDPNGGHHNGPAPLPFDPRAHAPAKALQAAIRALARLADAPSHVTDARLGIVCAWLLAEPTPIARLRAHPDAPNARNALVRALADAKATSDRPPEQWYAGKCPKPDCGRDLYARMGEPTVTCRCGTRWDVAARRTDLLAAVRNQLAPGPDIARALTTMGNPVTPDRLRKWKHRGRLTVRQTTGGPGTGKPQTHWFRVGDVLDLLAADEATTAKRRGGKP